MFSLFLAIQKNQLIPAVFTICLYIDDPARTAPLRLVKHLMLALRSTYFFAALEK